MCVCIYIYIYIHICYVYIYTYVYTHAFVVCLSVSLFVCLSVCVSFQDTSRAWGVCILPHLEVRGSRLRAFRQKQASTAQVPPREFAGLTAAEYFRKRSRHCFDFQKTRAPNRGTLSCPQESALGSAWNCSSKAANGNERIGAHLSTVKS